MNVYEEIGVRTVINACGSVTRLGGAPISPGALAAFTGAAGAAVPLEELQAAASRILAGVTGAEAAIVTSGASSALTLGAAAILAGLDPGRMERLPETSGFPNEFIVAREQRNGYDHAVRAAGARLVEVGCNELVAGSGVRRTEPWEYEAAIGPNTAGVLYVHAADARPRLEEVAALARRKGLPVLVDAAAELPPKRNLTALIQAGADLVAFSGGKALRGPQSTGILCGKRRLVASALLQMLDMDDHPELWSPPRELIDRSEIAGMPRHGIGRGFKVSKEEIAALVAAVRAFQQGAYDEEVALYRPRLARLAKDLEGLPLSTRIVAPDDEEQFPVLQIATHDSGRDAMEICRRLRDGEPRIFVGHARLHEGYLVIHPLCLRETDFAEIARRIREETSGEPRSRGA